MAELDDRNDRTLFVGNVDRSCKEETLFELFLQAGPLKGVKIAKEKDSGTSRGFAFIEYKHDISVPYALHLFGGTSLYGRQLTLKFRNGSKHENNQWQGPPPQAFPKGFPEQTPSPYPPNAQRLPLPLPYANNHHAMPTPENMWPQPPGGSMEGRYRDSPEPYFHGSPHHSPSQAENFHGGFQRRQFEQPYGNDVATSSRSPHWESPPLLRQPSPRREGQYRGEVVERPHQHYDVDSGRSHRAGRDRSDDRRGNQRNQQLQRSQSFGGGGHSRRDNRHQPREEERHHRGRERRRTTEEDFREYRGERQGGRDRSTEDYGRHRHGHRGNNDYRPHHYR